MTFAHCRPFTAKPYKMTHTSQDGFTLLETLIALAILSFVSLALFQSSSTLLSVSDRAVKSGERTLDGALNRLAFSRVIDGILPHWPEQAETGFTGDGKIISGISTENLNSENTNLSAFTFQIIQTGDEANSDKTSLIYTVENLSWPLDINLPLSAHFSFLGRDQKWHDKWPLDEDIPSVFDMDEPFLHPQLIPHAISIRDSKDHVYWLAEIRHHRKLPPRFTFSLEN